MYNYIKQSLFVKISVDRHQLQLVLHVFRPSVGQYQRCSAVFYANAVILVSTQYLTLGGTLTKPERHVMTAYTLKDYDTAVFRGLKRRSPR
jgi:hypothetical protein